MKRSNRVKPPLDDHLIIRVSKQTKDYLTRTAEQYGMFPTTLGRHLIERQLPTIQKNRFYEFTP